MGNYTGLRGGKSSALAINTRNRQRAFNRTAPRLFTGG